MAISQPVPIAGTPVIVGGKNVGVAEYNPNTGQPLSGANISANPGAINPNTGQPLSYAPPTGSTQPQSNTQNTNDSTATPPQTTLAPGSTGVNVEQLQSYLTQMGYLTPQQVSGGAGTYGPNTTAAVAKLQKDLGIQAGSDTGDYGPKTQAALAQKYQGIFGNLNSTTAPDSAAAANTAIQSYTQPSSDSVVNGLQSNSTMLQNALAQVLSNITNPAITGSSLQTEYNNLANQYQLPQMDAQLLNMQNVMTGTDSDIRNEITTAGGTGTESQVLALTTARNNVILKQYNALNTTYQANVQNVSNMMQYASTDQQTALQEQNNQASIIEYLQGMAQTMQQNTNSNLNKIVTNVGYQGLAAQAQDNPQVLSYYEQNLGLSPGALSNPQSLAQLETYRQQTIAQGAQKVQIQMYNAGLSTGTTSTNTPGGYITSPTGTQSLVATNLTGSDSQGRPYNVTQAQSQSLLKGGATVDPGTNNIVVPGVGYYVAQSDGSYRLSVDPTSTEGQYIQYSNMVNNPTPVSSSPLNARRESMVAQAAIKNYVASPIYQNVSQGAVYLSRINSAMTDPGSVSDLELADSIIKINNGGGQVTDAQLSTYFSGQSFGDQFAIVGDKLTAKGGVLSPQQRSDLSQLASQTFSKYRDQYQQLYVEAMKNMQSQNIPDAYWGNFPDFTSFLSQS